MKLGDFKMKVHLALWRKTDTNEITSACGIKRTPENFVIPKDMFLSHTNPNDVCKRCAKIYNRTPW